MIGTGTRVCYTQAHFEWLLEAGRWSKKHPGRRKFLGTVAGVSEDGAVHVLWDAWRPWPRRDKQPASQPSIHLRDNLEEVEA